MYTHHQYPYSHTHSHIHTHKNIHKHKNIHIHTQQDINNPIHNKQNMGININMNMGMLKTKTIKQQIQDNKYHNIKYQKITKAIDVHNKHATNQLNHIINSESCRNQVQLGINDQLIIMYTDAIYQQYCIPKPMSMDASGVIKTEMDYKHHQVKCSQHHNRKVKLKTIVRKSKHNIMSSPHLNLLTSPQMKKNKYVPIKQINLNANQTSNNTPVKPKIQGIKKSGLSTTAGSNFSHGRSKTGGIISTTHAESIQQNDGSQTHRTVNNTKTKQDEVIVSQFGSGWFEQQVQPSSPQLQLQNQNQLTKNKKRQSNKVNFAINENKLKRFKILGSPNQEKITKINKSRELQINQNSYQNCLCPICEQEVNARQIYDHEEDCKGLKQLYELSYEKLVEFVNWKIKNHKGNIIQLLNMNQPLHNNIQSIHEQKSNNTSDRQLEQPRSKMGLDNYKYYGQISNQTKQIISQCNEHVNKCCWFQVVKKNLLSKTDTIMQ